MAGCDRPSVATRSDQTSNPPMAAAAPQAESSALLSDARVQARRRAPVGRSVRPIDRRQRLGDAPTCARRDVDAKPGSAGARARNRLRLDAVDPRALWLVAVTRDGSALVPQVRALPVPGAPNRSLAGILGVRLAGLPVPRRAVGHRLRRQLARPQPATPRRATGKRDP